MARRTYLSRIAQPLTARDPAVASIPRAAAEESRPTVSAAPPLAPLPRAQSANAEPIREAAGERAVPYVETPASSMAPTSMPPPARETSPPMSGREDQVAAPTASHRGVARASASIPHRLFSNGPSSEPAYSTASDFAAFGEAAAPTIAASAALRSKTLAQAPEPIVPFEPIPAALPAFGTASKRESPRLHIGAIEVRVAQPPPPQPTPTLPIKSASVVVPSAAASLSSPYASRFGLAQG